jgi:hypothetical protein
MKAPSMPVALYRLEFNKEFTFSQATELVPYLASFIVRTCEHSRGTRLPGEQFRGRRAECKLCPAVLTCP